MEETKVMVKDLETLEEYEASMAEAEDEPTTGSAIMKIVGFGLAGISLAAGAVYGIKKIPAVQDWTERCEAKKELNKKMKADQRKSRLEAKQQKQLEVEDLDSTTEVKESTSENK